MGKVQIHNTTKTVFDSTGVSVLQMNITPKGIGEEATDSTKVIFDIDCDYLQAISADLLTLKEVVVIRDALSALIEEANNLGAE